MIYTKRTRLIETGIFLSVLCLLVFAGAAKAAELGWTLPTTKANGEPVAEGELTAITVYSGASKLATLGGSETRYTVPSCTARTYHVTASIGDFESAASNTASTVPLASECRPQAPSGLGIAASP